MKITVPWSSKKLGGGSTDHVGDGGNDQMAPSKRKCYVLVPWVKSLWPSMMMVLLVQWASKQPLIFTVNGVKNIVNCMI